jgi:hypothetical protein|tara:strand:+ start:619 stop:1521 length:903 start_codon:yes stop_codon:yes gene_type:complete
MSVQEYLEPAVKDYADQAKATYSAELDPQTFMGKQYVAGEDPLQTQAINLAQQGVGSYQPFLQAAQTAQAAGAGALGQSAQTVGGLSALTGANAYQPFMSPYQSQVIDATLSEFDKQRVAGEQNIKDQAMASGNFGGGREGAQLGQYQANSLADRSALQASMLQQGFQQAQQAAQQNFMNQGSIAAAQQGLAGAYGNQMNQQFGLSDFNRTGMGQDVSALGSLGALRQGQSQAELSAQQQADQASAYEPYGRMNQYGNTLTGLLGGVAGSQYQQPGSSSPWQGALSTALGIGGLYGKIFG